MTIAWTQDMALGIRQIDLQHQELIDLINRLDAARQTGMVPALLAGLLGELNAYTRFHFLTEENLLQTQREAQAHCVRHAGEHRDFIAALHVWQSQAPESLDFGAVQAFLENWVVQHIQHTDREMLRWLQPGA